jgi:hypothetical protein
VDGVEKAVKEEVEEEAMEPPQVEEEAVDLQVEEEVEEEAVDLPEVVKHPEIVLQNTKDFLEFMFLMGKRSVLLH